MRDTSHKSRIAIILDHVDAWRHSMDWSRETVCDVIVEAHYRIGADRLTQVKFERTGDLVTIQKNNADRIYRWLDDKSKDRNLLCSNFEQSILAAMPADIRLAYLNDILAPLGFVVRGIEPEENHGLNATHHVVNMARESAEALGAVADLISNPTPAKLALADRELADLEEETRITRADIRREMTLKAA
jgi:hypothetical protein